MNTCLCPHRRTPEKAALSEEKAELAADEQGEARELAAIYVRRGLQLHLAREVAAQLMQHDALGAHARDELGISQTLAARPLQAALASACSFAAGAALPLAVVLLTPVRQVIPASPALHSLRSPALAASPREPAELHFCRESCV